MLVQIIALTLPVEKLFLQADVPPVLKVTLLMQGIFVWHWYFFISRILPFVRPPMALSLQFLSPVFYPCFTQRNFLNSTTSVSFMLSATMSFSMFWSVPLVTKLSACLKNDFTLFQSPFELSSPVLSVFWHLPSPAGCFQPAVIWEPSYKVFHLSFSETLLMNLL